MEGGDIWAPMEPRVCVEHKDYRAVADVPFNPECEIVPEGETLDQRYQSCPKRGGHSSFIPIKDLRMEHLPEACRTHHFMQEIAIVSALTVKVTAFYVSKSRPDTFQGSSEPYPFGEYRDQNLFRVGTGYIFYDSIQKPIIEGTCPCHRCQTSESPATSYMRVIVGTSTHVVYDSSEAEQMVCQCFYDKEDNRSEIKVLYGIGAKIVSKSHRCYTDYCEIICVTHDHELMLRLLNLTVMDRFHYYRTGLPACRQAIIVSHPHGGSKHISLGRIIHGRVLKDPHLPTQSRLTFGPDTKCLTPVQPLSLHNPSRNHTHSYSITETGGISLKTFYPNAGTEEDIGISQANSCATSGGGWSFRRALQWFKDMIKSPKSPTPSNHAGSGLSGGYREVPIRPGMTFTLPADCKELGCFMHPLNDQKIWVKFPEETTFAGPDGEAMVFPVESYFQWSEMDNIISKSLHYVTYDMATCSGCSGAPILACSSKYLALFLFHAGVVKDDLGHNRSGLTPVFGLQL